MTSPTSPSPKSATAKTSSIGCTSLNAATFVDRSAGFGYTHFRVANYHLSSTLSSGQVFRWQPLQTAWQGIVNRHGVELESTPDGIRARAWPAPADWHWLRHYLQIDVDLASILDSFPRADPHLAAAVRASPGLRLLRQHPWECLASFILSSSKQIVQIQQVIRLLCQHFGQPIPSHPHLPHLHAFPTASALAQASEADLRACKMGFRAPALIASARRIADGSLNLEALAQLPADTARRRLLELPGVGPKIANCVLLFAYGIPEAFPIDVWVFKALRQLYFRGRPVQPGKLEAFARAHFGPNAGYAQQYLFHYLRVHLRRAQSLP